MSLFSSGSCVSNGCMQPSQAMCRTWASSSGRTVFASAGACDNSMCYRHIRNDGLNVCTSSSAQDHCTSERQCLCECQAPVAAPAAATAAAATTVAGGTTPPTSDPKQWCAEKCQAH